MRHETPLRSGWRSKMGGGGNGTLAHGIGAAEVGELLKELSPFLVRFWVLNLFIDAALVIQILFLDFCCWRRVDMRFNLFRYSQGTNRSLDWMSIHLCLFPRLNLLNFFIMSQNRSNLALPLIHFYFMFDFPFLELGNYIDDVVLADHGVIEECTATWTVIICSFVFQNRNVWCLVATLKLS